MPKSESEFGKGSKDDLESLGVEQFGEDYISRVRRYRKAADDRLAEMKTQGLVDRRRPSLPEEERQRLMEQFGLSQSLVRGQSQEDES